MKEQRPRPYAKGVTRAWARIADPEGPRAGMLAHTERKLREAITHAYFVRTGLAEAETVVATALADARRVYRDRNTTPAEGDRLAEALYCHEPSVTYGVAHARLLAPESVTRRFERITERPRRLDERLPEPARVIEHGGYPVGEWLEELVELADLLDAYHDAITLSLTRLADVNENLSAYVTGERAFRPSATASLGRSRTQQTPGKAD